MVDNSSAFRMTEGVPLVVPEINPDAMADIKLGGGGIIANPNCSTIIALMAVTGLHRAKQVDISRELDLSTSGSSEKRSSGSDWPIPHLCDKAGIWDLATCR